MLPAAVVLPVRLPVGTSSAGFACNLAAAPGGGPPSPFGRCRPSWQVPVLLGEGTPMHQPHQSDPQPTGTPARWDLRTGTAHQRSYRAWFRARRAGARCHRGRSAGRLASPGILLPARAPVSRARPDPTRIPAHPPCRHDGPAPPGACATQQGPVRQHARPTPRPLLPRHRHRPRHRQHAGPRPRPRDRDLRAVGRRHRREDQARARDRRRGEADGRPDAGLDHRGPPAARRRHQRLRRHRADDQVLREQGARPDRADPAAADAARASRRA